LRRAREAAPQAARPLVLAGQRAARRGAHTEVLQLWGVLMVANPTAFNLVVREYATSALACGEGQPALQRLLERYGQMPTLDLLEAIALLDPSPAHQRERLLAQLHSHPTLSAAQALLTQPDSTALSAIETKALRDAIGRAALPLHRYRCAACGFEAQHYFWQCPGCLSWDSYPPQRLEDF
jgi:lipopolysaccharide biosynthesis regulator YciM